MFYIILFLTNIKYFMFKNLIIKKFNQNYFTIYYNKY